MDQKKTVRSFDICDAIKIAAPDWFRRADFLDYIGNTRKMERVATWYEPALGAGSLSDVFVTCYVSDTDTDGSNSDMPADIWAEICEIARKLSVRNGVVWITNTEDKNDV